MADPEDLPKRLLAVLNGVGGPAVLLVEGKIARAAPTLEVAGVGPVPLPLSGAKADELKRLARPAPYGKGAETLVDPDVRRAWEIDAGLVALSGGGWDDALARTVAAVGRKLGFEDSELRAHPYKLLLYEEGGFFLPHRDGEKLDGMVATLVVSLPSEHEGGELIVRHDGRRKTARFGGPKRSGEFRYAAFHADREHEVKPVTGGRRLVLTYNLTVAKSSREADDGPAAAVADLLRPWSRAAGGPEGAAPKLAVLLDHAYTQAGLALDTLKGSDRDRADVLFEAARRSDCDAFLAIVTLFESGMGEDDYDRWDRRRRWRRYEDEDEEDGGLHTMVEVYETKLTAGWFRDADGRAWDVGAVGLLESEIVADEKLSDASPDREEYEGYTGNEGMTLERWYHRAAIVLWPRSSRFDALLAADVDAAVGGLAAMIARRSAAKDRTKEKAALGEACRTYARRLIDAWPSRRRSEVRYSWQRSDPPPTDVPLLELLVTIGDPDLVAAWIRGPFARDATLDPGPALGEACDRFGWSTLADALDDAFAASSRETIERDARLLADWSGRSAAEPVLHAIRGRLAGSLLAFLEGWREPEAPRDWSARAVDRGPLLATLVRSLIESDDAEGIGRLTTALRDPASGWDLHAVQIPVLRELRPWLEREVRKPAPPLRGWLTTVRDELRRRTAAAPVEPADLVRDASIECVCEDCAAVSKFLRDPSESTFRLRAVQHRREHVETRVKLRNLDLARSTERKGSPHTLVLTKTTASYQRALAIHRADLEYLEEIGAMLSWLDGRG